MNRSPCKQKKWIYYGILLDSNSQVSDNSNISAFPENYAIDLSAICKEVTESNFDNVKSLAYEELLEWAAAQNFEKISEEIKIYLAEKKKRDDIINGVAPASSTQNTKDSKKQAPEQQPPGISIEQQLASLPALQPPSMETVAKLLKHKISDLIRDLHERIKAEERARKEAEGSSLREADSQQQQQFPEQNSSEAASPANHIQHQRQNPPDFNNQKGSLFLFSLQSIC